MKTPRRAAAFAVWMALTGPACQTAEKPAESAPPESLGGQAGSVISDTQTLGDANAAAGEVVRNAQDCAAANAALPAAEQALDEASANVRTASGRQSLEALRTQVKRVAEACVGVQ